MTARVVIVGAGQAGLSCAAALRAGGFAGTVHLIGEEADAPYQRPPLSKAYLLGQMTADRLLLRPPGWYEDQRITLQTATPVRAIDRAARLVLRADGSALPYDALVLATGAAARPLPATLHRGLSGLHTLRNRAEVEVLRPALARARDVLVIGGGFIGLEMAAVARGLGLRVALVEQAPQLLGRVSCAETAAELAALHRAKGVAIYTGRGVTRLLGDDAVCGAVLDDGTELPADLVIAGIGAIPRTDLAAAAGLPLSNGILTDATGRTADPHIFAAGDCACYRLPGGDLRLESVGNAIDTAEVVARTILNQTAPYVPRPWFWSDQFEMKLQIAGCGAPGDRVVVRPGPGRSHWYYRDGRLVAVDALNAPQAYQAGRRMVLAGLTPDPARIANPQIPLKDILTDLAPTG